MSDVAQEKPTAMTVDVAAQRLRDAVAKDKKNGRDTSHEDIKAVMSDIDKQLQGDQAGRDEFLRQLNAKLVNDKVLPHVVMTFGDADFDLLKAKPKDGRISKSDLESDKTKLGSDKFVEQMLLSGMIQNYDAIEKSQHESRHKFLIFSSGEAEGISKGRLEKFDKLTDERSMSEAMIRTLVAKPDVFQTLSSKKEFITKQDLEGYKVTADGPITQDMLDFMRKHFKDLSEHGKITSESISKFAAKHGVDEVQVAKKLGQEESARKQAEADKATAEAARKQAETDKAAAEAARKQAETDKATAEAARKQAQADADAAKTAQTAAEATTKAALAKVAKEHAQFQEAIRKEKAAEREIKELKHASHHRQFDSHHPVHDHIVVMHDKFIAHGTVHVTKGKWTLAQIAESYLNQHGKDHPTKQEINNVVSDICHATWHKQYRPSDTIKGPRMLYIIDKDLIGPINHRDSKS